MVVLFYFDGQEKFSPIRNTFQPTEENEGREKKVNHVISGERAFQA